MKNRRLGDLEVSEIGFGAWGLGGKSYGAISYTEAYSAVRFAIAQGITFFDTADWYGSEELLGYVALDVPRYKMVIATKGGYGTNWTADEIHKAFLRSKERLGVDYIDLYQLHNPPPDVFERDYRLHNLLFDLKQEGLIKEFGISTKSPNDALKFMNGPNRVNVLQVNFNMLDLRALDIGLFSGKTGIIARTPLCFGFLSGKVDLNSVFSADDHRSRCSSQQLKHWGKGAPTVQALVTKEPSETWAQTALRFCLSYSSVGTVIPGIMSTTEAIENASVSDMPKLSPEELRAIEAFNLANPYNVSA